MIYVEEIMDDNSRVRTDKTFKTVREANAFIMDIITNRCDVLLTSDKDYDDYIAKVRSDYEIIVENGGDGDVNDW